MDGGPGDDRLIGGEELRGGGGADRINGTGYKRDSHTDQIVGGDGNDRIVGDGSGNGNDDIDAGDGDDDVRGGRGNDDIDGGPGNDTCDPGGGAGAVVNCEM
jgi:Ca2+-binding RTX toxin-like protein